MEVRTPEGERGCPNVRVVFYSASLGPASQSGLIGSMGSRSCYAVHGVHRGTSTRVSANEFDGIAPSARDTSRYTDADIGGSLLYRRPTTSDAVVSHHFRLPLSSSRHRSEAIKSSPWKTRRRWQITRARLPAPDASQINLLSVNVAGRCSWTGRRREAR